MQCADCSCWIISEFTYHALCEKWTELIGDPLTPGYRKRFEKEGQRLGIPASEVRLVYKYCLKGKLNRFYIVKHPNDTRPSKKVTDCSGFTTATMGGPLFPIPSPLWSICMREAHSPTRVKGQIFYPGLREHHCYSRIPAHGTIKPQLIDEGTCDVCGNEFSQGISVREATHFCCNKHYLQWWKKRNPEMYEKLNKEY